MKNSSLFFKALILVRTFVLVEFSTRISASKWYRIASFRNSIPKFQLTSGTGSPLHGNQYQNFSAQVVLNRHFTETSTKTLPDEWYRIVQAFKFSTTGTPSRKGERMVFWLAKNGTYCYNEKDNGINMG